MAGLCFIPRREIAIDAALNLLALGPDLNGFDNNKCSIRTDRDSAVKGKDFFGGLILGKTERREKDNYNDQKNKRSGEYFQWIGSLTE